MALGDIDVHLYNYFQEMTYMKILVFFHIIADFYTNYKFELQYAENLSIYSFCHEEAAWCCNNIVTRPYKPWITPLVLLIN